MVAHLVQHHHRAQLLALGRQGGELALHLAQHDFIQAVTRVAQAGLLQVARVGVGHTVAQALAARLVVDPHHGQPGALQHVEQVFVAVAAFFVRLFAQVRKHAGYRCLGVGAARAHIAEVGQLPLPEQGVQLGGGVAGVAAQAEVGGARGFTHHHHQQGGPGLVGVAGAGAGIFAHGLQGLLRAWGGVGHHPGHGIHAVERVDEVAHLLVVAHDRCKVLEHHIQRQARHQGGHQQRGGVGADAAQCLGRAHGLPPQPPGGQHAQHQQCEDQAQREQVGGFLGVGVQHVDQHAGVDEGGKRQHEVGGCRRTQQQDHRHRLEDPWPGQQADEHRQHAPQPYAHAQHEAQAAPAVDFGQRPQLLPQRHVAGGGQPQGQQCHQCRGVPAQSGVGIKGVGLRKPACLVALEESRKHVEVSRREVCGHGRHGAQRVRCPA